mmetsp:Transcript_27086/g.30911  ORF Transcript_27086/g.30911 Transcript_27086/m.30911 type:complete len:91 (+) Transcript_27086:829-1101(+)
MHQSFHLILIFSLLLPNDDLSVPYSSWQTLYRVPKKNDQHVSENETKKEKMMTCCNYIRSIFLLLKLFQISPPPRIEDIVNVTAKRAILY